MRNVYLIPGFTASDLAILATAEKLWWDPNFAVLVGIGPMRLAPNGVDPGPPDGAQMAVVLPGQSPWPAVRNLLKSQLPSEDWAIEIGPYDWRFSLRTTAKTLANNIRLRSTPANPGTIVGHSAGGLIAVLAWADLVSTGESNKVRRIISICSPFQGSYAPIQWLTGSSDTVKVLTSVSTLAVQIGLVNALKWGLAFLNGVALTWPAFYELFPYLGGTEASRDPFRFELYNVSAYPDGIRPSGIWLQSSLTGIQPLIAGDTTHPPLDVMTTVVAKGVNTYFKLSTGKLPLNLFDLQDENEGDGVVTVGSQSRSPARVVEVIGAHADIPLGLAASGVLAELILDPRSPITPPAPPLEVKPAIGVNVTAAPESNPFFGLQCIGGG